MKPIRVLLWSAGMVVCIVTTVQGAAALRGVASRGFSAVAVGDAGRILYTFEAPHNDAWHGAEWPLFEDLRAVTTTGTGYVAVGQSGIVIRSVDPSGYGSQWLAENSGTTFDLYGVAHAGNRLVAVGDSAVVLWKQDQSQGDWLLVDPAGVPTGRALRATAGNNSYAVAVGDSGTVIWTYALNMATWNQVADLPTDVDLRGIGAGPGAAPGRFWAVGEGGVILRSLPNVTQWDLLSSPTTVDLNGVAFFGLYGVAVGDDGTILYSNGGDIWTPVDAAGTTEDLYGVAYTGSGAGGGFVAVGDENAVLWSHDGLVWQGAIVATREASWGSIRGSWRSR